MTVRTIEQVKAEIVIPSVETLNGPVSSWRQSVSWIGDTSNQELTDERIAKIDAYVAENWKDVVAMRKYYEGSTPTELTDEQAQFFVDRDIAQDNLNKKVNEFTKALSEAESIADKFDLEFDLDTAYGMGGSYRNGEWHPSSQSC